MQSKSIVLNLSSPFDHFYHELDSSKQTFIILQSIIGGVTIFGSVIVLLLFYKTSSSGSARKYFIALAVSDLQGSILLTVIFIHGASTKLRVNDPYCIESISGVTYSLLLNLLLLVSMTVDRYFAILYPLKHKRYSQSSITTGVIVGCWIGGSVAGVCCYYTSHEFSPHPGAICFVTTERLNHYFAFFCIIFIIFPSMVVFVFGYMRIFKVILVSMKTYSSSNKIKDLGKIIIRRNSRETTLKGISVREVRATLILFLSIISFLLMCIPGPIAYIIYGFFPEHASLNLGYTTLLSCQLNSLINPFLYARNIKDADKIIVQWIKVCFCIGNK